MLLAMVAQAMSVLYVKLARMIVRLFTQDDRDGNCNSPEVVHDPTPRSWASAGSEPQGSAAEIWFSTYRIGDCAERNQVLLSLIMVQLAQFSKILNQLKERAREGVQQAILASAERKVRGIRPLLLRSHQMQTRTVGEEDLMNDATPEAHGYIS
jgi:hypothetical protein